MSTASPAYVHAGAASIDSTSSRHSGLHNRVVLVRWGRFSIATFGLLSGLGGAAATTFAIARQTQAGMEPGRFAVALWLVLPVVVVVGSRLLSLALEWKDLCRAPWQTIRRHGFSFQGGLLLVIAGLGVLAMAYELDLLLLFDTAVLALPLGHALGRLGCHTYGCCHGQPTRSPIAIRYTHPESKAVWRAGLRGVALHPTQLYSALGNLTLFAILSWLATQPMAVGALSATYLVLGSLGRFTIELLRGVPVPRRLGLTPFQWVAAVTFVAGLTLAVITSTGEPSLLFAGRLVDALRMTARHAWAPAWVFVAFLLVFGVHGRRLGRPSGR